MGDCDDREKMGGMKLEDTDVVFALKDGVLTHISNVESGLECGCVCTGCGVRMIAKKGKIKSHHFAHLNADCEHAYESMIHYMCKFSFLEIRKFKLPRYIDSRYNSHHGFYFEELLLNLENFDIAVEYKYNDIVSDVAILRNGNPVLFIEIANTHFIDEVKLSKIKDYKISCIEIDVSRFHIEFDRLPSNIANWMSVQSLKEYMEDNSKWVFNRKMAAQYKIECLKLTWIDNNNKIWKRLNKAKELVELIKKREITKEFEYFYNNQ
jgi:hypothetical protein